MNNELGRKITSLTLMTIMVAGGMTFAFPGFMPAAHAANPDLFVSAESSRFQDFMSGPQVIEVIVTDPALIDTDESKGEPTVTVGGNELRMVQSTDGKWYAYFADATQAYIADATTEGVTTAGALAGLDFGTFCGKTSTIFSDDNTALFSQTVAIAVATNATGGVNGTAAQDTTPVADCTAFSGTAANGTLHENVVREAEDINTFFATDIGQIDLRDVNFWPFIQLYDLNPTGPVKVLYDKGGDPQSVTLTFDTVDQLLDDEENAVTRVDIDREVYPQGAAVHAIIWDTWLNIDPTDEDSWTFGTNSTYLAADTAAGDNDGASTNYQVFDESGGIQGAGITGGIIDISPVLSTMMIRDNAVLIIDTNAQSVSTPVLTLQDNQDTVITCSDAQAAETCIVGGIADNGLARNTQPVTITEYEPNTGEFRTFDDSTDTSILIITDGALQGTSATIDYNASPVSINTDYSYGSVEIQPIDDEWNSGEEIPVEVVDADQNKNSRVDEDLVVSNPDITIIPALETGDPFTLGEGTSTPQVLYVGWPGITLTGSSNAGDLNTFASNGHRNVTATAAVDSFSERAIITNTTATDLNTTNFASGLIIDLGTTFSDLTSTITDETGAFFTGHNFLNVDLNSLSTTNTYDVYLLNTSGTDGIINAAGTNVTASTVGVLGLVNNVAAQSLTGLNTTVNDAIFNGATEGTSTTTATNSIGIAIVTSGNTTINGNGLAANPIVVDFFSFGFSDDGVQASERIANQIIRIEVEETGDNTGIFIGSLEYVMVNQLNIFDESTYLNITPIADDPSFIVIEDLTDEDAPQVSYLDVDQEGELTTVSDREAAPSHSGVVSLNQDSYKIADTVIITLEDVDLNVDSDLNDIYTVVNLGVDDTTGSDDVDNDQVGVDVGDGSVTPVSGTNLETLSFGSQGRLLDVTFDDAKWTNEDPCDPGGFDGLAATQFTLKETGASTGVFEGSFLIQADWCRPDGAIGTTGVPETTTGLDIEVNYVDYRDASGEIIEVGDSAGVRANTGSVSLDRTVYPVPFGGSGDFTANSSEAPAGRSLFPVHATGLGDALTVLDDTAGETLVGGDLTIHVRVNDPDFDINPAGVDFIAANTTNTLTTGTTGDAVGPIKISVIRGSDEVVLGYAGGPTALDGLLDVGDDAPTATRQLGPIDEIDPSSGIYELDLSIRYTDGPASATCPSGSKYTPLDGTTAADNNESARFDAASASGQDYCILQGDILQVEYTDPADASGDQNTVTDSATFDLRNGVLQSDKSVYIIGSDMILTLIEPDFDLDNDGAETYDLDLIEWDSDAATTTMGNLGVTGAAVAFDPEPTDFRETGDSTGIFQIVIEIPQELNSDTLERGEEIILEYTDWGPSGSDYVGDEDEDVNITLFTSNFGATVELDQKVYTWTDKVYITIVAPDHNFDGDLIDEIGNEAADPIKVSTRGFDLDNYKLVETGTDTGIFTGEVILTGFTTQDADGDGTGSDASGLISTDNGGPTDGLLPTDDDDGLTVSFEFSEDETVVGSALIRWNIGETQWLEASYPASGTGVVRVIDPDMNFNPEAVDNFEVDVWSDSDAGGIDLTVTETNEATGIFEGTVFFTTTDESSGHRLRVAEGDTVTAEYEDNTLPDPYTTADELDITATTLIGTVVPPLERAPAANLRTVDAFGNSLDSVSVDQQVQFTADLANGQDREQVFAYLLQVQDSDGVTVKLDWITGSLSSGQSFSPAVSWTPSGAGAYTATVFVWESVDNPTALSPPVSITVNVN
ncbi:MAG: hypothetical protein HRO68_08560 [Nitrosopumilus sp.]|nr:hypothetical protein [Nitrosopumilus sp.]